MRGPVNWDAKSQEELAAKSAEFAKREIEAGLQQVLADKCAQVRETGLSVRMGDSGPVVSRRFQGAGRK